jgi:HAD superfamily hydrolase (TIGR01549 family)
MENFTIDKKIKNIIFDLGGVVVNVDYHKTINEFKKLGAQNFEKIYTQLQQSELFDRFETGRITPSVFRKDIRKATMINIEDDKIDYAWNAMILDLPEERLELLQIIKPKYRTFLLSNTNEIHMDFFNEYLLETFGVPDLSDYFEKVYYSHQIGLRKPNKEVFDYIIRVNKLNPEETLFIDDSPQHVEGAKKVGLTGYQLTNGKSITQLF